MAVVVDARLFHVKRVSLSVSCRDVVTITSGERLLNQLVERQLALLGLYLGKLRARLGVARGEDGTTVLIRQDGRLKGIDLACDLHDFFFVKTNTGAEYGEIRHNIGYANGGHGLTCYLADGFARNKGAATALMGDARGNGHHVAAQKECKVVFLAVAGQFFLNFGQRDDVNVNIARVFGQNACQLQHLLNLRY